MGTTSAQVKDWIGASSSKVKAGQGQVKGRLWEAEYTCEGILGCARGQFLSIWKCNGDFGPLWKCNADFGQIKKANGIVGQRL